MITLFGATGHTGQLTAIALDQAGLPFRIAGRSADRLQALSQKLASKPTYQVVDVGYAQSIPLLIKDTNILINCVGPFTDLGEKILSQAAVNGVHYLDTTNELGFAYRIQSYQRIATQSNSAIVPACAFEVALADCVVRSLSSRTKGQFDEIQIVYHLKGQRTSPGTRRSALRSLATSWVMYRDGYWVGQAPGTKTRQFVYQDRRYPAMAIPSCESITIPAHTGVKSIDTWMTISNLQAFFAPLVVPYFARFLRSIAGSWLQKIMGRTRVPDEFLSSHEPFQILIFALRNKEVAHAISITGKDPYGLIAKILIEAARKVQHPDFNLKGVLPPSAVLGGKEFFDIARDWPIEIEGLVR